MYETVRRWASEVQASRFIDYLRESDLESLAYSERREYKRERHTFESVLDLTSFDEGALRETIDRVQQSGISFVTLAEEPGEENERKLYELYKVTNFDIPGHSGGYPWYEEWKKWSLDQTGCCPEWMHIAKDGERYIGVVTLVHIEQTGAMYHEFTGVLPDYRGRRIALALKLLAIRTARSFGAPYLRTHNDSMNAPMLRINRDLLGFRAEKGLYKMVRELNG
ncbi:GNAT family N-acetyltransferase [Paenibacillus sp. CC-CFT747]|nr:GNAT family N-acetyltransferase [Paenibacillus sp. CC-CFT747]